MTNGSGIEGERRPNLVRIIGASVREIPASPEVRKPKVSVFFDGDYLHHSLDRLGIKAGVNAFDFRTVLDILGEGKQIVEALYFTGISPTPYGQEAKNRFLIGLSKLGIGSFTIPSYKRDEDEVDPKDPVDHYIIQEMAMRYRKYDEAVLISGDGHFINIVRRLLEIPKKVTIVAADGDLHRGLRGSGAKIEDLLTFVPGTIPVKPVDEIQVS